MDTIYVPATDSRGNFYPKGPGDGLCFDGWLLYPSTRFSSQEVTEKVAHLMNIAYEEGKKATQTDIKKALGIK